MILSERTKIASHVAVIILSGVVAVCAIVLTVAALRIMDGGQMALATVNQGCAPGPCGTLAAFTKAVTKGGDAIVTTQMQELAVVKRVSPVLDSLGTIPQHANGTLDSLTTTEMAATGTLQAASRSVQVLSDDLTPVLSHADSTVIDLDAGIKVLQPTETALSKSVADFDRVVNNPSIPTILTNVSGMTDSGNKMLFTFNVVEQKATHSYLHPPHGAAAIWPTIRPFLLPITQVGGAVAIEVAK